MTRKTYAQVSSEAKAEGFVEGYNKARRELSAQVDNRKFAMVEDTLIQMSQMANAQTQLAVTMAAVLRHAMEQKP